MPFYRRVSRSLKLNVWLRFPWKSDKLTRMDLSESEKRKIIVVVGATGCGKTKVAVEICKRFNGEAISTDSMQIYHGLDIATNKVTPEEAQGVPHHMISFLDPLTTGYTALNFRNKALQIIADIHRRNKVPVIVGGTNYYMETILWKILLNDLEYSDEDDNNEQITFHNIMKNLPEPFLRMTDEQLFAELVKVDPAEASVVLPTSRRRVQRCLQYYFTHGRPISDRIKEQRGEKGGNAIGGPLRFKDSCMLWVKCDLDVLDQRLNQRIDQMLQKGLLNELSNFYDRYFHEYQRIAKYYDDKYADGWEKGVVRCIGLKQFMDYLAIPKDQRVTVDQNRETKVKYHESVERLRIATRQYARRQIKWIRNRCLADDRCTPPIYALDATDPVAWNEKVSAPVKHVVAKFLANETPDIVPEPRKPAPVRGDLRKRTRCAVCEKTMIAYALDIHIKSKRHVANVAEQRRLLIDITRTLDYVINEIVNE